MKKLLVGLLIFGLLSVPVLASPVATELTDTTINATTTDTGWLQHYVGAAERIAFFVTLDSSSTTSAATLGVTIQTSVDGSNWTDIKWYDLVGGTTAQVNETLAEQGDETYLMWLNTDIVIPHIRIKISNEGTWDTQTNAVTVTIVEDK